MGQPLPGRRSHKLNAADALPHAAYEAWRQNTGQALLNRAERREFYKQVANHAENPETSHPVRKRGRKIPAQVPSETALPQREGKGGGPGTTGIFPGVEVAQHVAGGTASHLAGSPYWHNGKQ